MNIGRIAVLYKSQQNGLRKESLIAMTTKFKKPKGSVFLLLAYMSITVGYSQNLLATNQDAFLEEKRVIFPLPATPSEALRNSFEYPASLKYRGGIRLSGSALTLDHILIFSVTTSRNSGLSIFIKDTGNVGAITSNPSDLLDVSSSNATVFCLYTESKTYNSKLNFTGKPGSGINFNHSVSAEGRNNKNFVLDSDESLLIKNNSSLSILVDGVCDVDIGTTVPSAVYKLTVGGHILPIRFRRIRMPDWIMCSLMNMSV